MDGDSATLPLRDVLITIVFASFQDSPNVVVNNHSRLLALLSTGKGIISIANFVSIEATRTFFAVDLLASSEPSVDTRAFFADSFMVSITIKSTQAFLAIKILTFATRETTQVFLTVSILNFINLEVSVALLAVIVVMF
jgi:hypothetical protein